MGKLKKKPWRTIIRIIIGLTIISFIFSRILNSFVPEVTGNVALIPIIGPIHISGYDLFGRAYISSDDIIKKIIKADQTPNIKAIVLEINSPGGSAVASEEVANTVKKTKKLTVAWIREIGTSGAYWIASSADYIIADRLSLTGSVGVLASYLEIAGLLQAHNITYRRLVAGKYKDIGSPFRELSPDEEELFKKQLNTIHNFFLNEVAKNRLLKEDAIKELSTGMFYLGSQALKLGLIDEIGGKEEVIQYIQKKLNITVKLVEYRKKRTLLDLLSQMINEKFFYIGKGIGSSLGFDRIRILT